MINLYTQIMEISSSTPNHVTNGRFLTALPGKLYSKLVSSAKEAKRVAKEDTRKVVHAVKVAVAVSLVSLFYYLHPLYGSLGESAMWAVLTVVVIFEFTVGATLGKGVNRIIATCVAGGLAVGAHRLADLSGEAGEPIILFICGFIVAAIFTFMRFLPELKARYDYGLMVFILTFSMVAASGYRDDEVFPVAWKRLVTIMIGCAIAIMVCILVCPVWNGEELHNLIASNLDKLGSFLEGFGDECFKDSRELNVESDKSLLVKYKTVLTTKSNEETMANFAKWEPRHGQFRYRHPWEQYLKIGTLARQCAYKIDALNNHLNSDSKMIYQEHFKNTFLRLSSETGKTLKELSTGLKKMKRVNLSVKTHLKDCKSTAEELKSLLESKGFDSEGLSFVDLLPIGLIASMLIEIATCVEEITVGVQELDVYLGHVKVAVDSVVVPTDVLSNRGEKAEREDLDKDKEGGDGHVVVVINNVRDGESVMVKNDDEKN